MSGGRLYSRRLTAPSGLRVDGAARRAPRGRGQQQVKRPYAYGRRTTKLG